MDAVRYRIALLLVAFGPPGILMWFSIHPLIRMWRKLGPRRTLVLYYFLVLLLASAIIAERKTILSVEFGTNPVLILCGVALLLAAIVLRVHIAKELKKRILVGIPELDPTSRLGGDLDFRFLDHAGAAAGLALARTVALCTRG